MRDECAIVASEQRLVKRRDVIPGIRAGTAPCHRATGDRRPLTDLRRGGCRGTNTVEIERRMDRMRSPGEQPSIAPHYLGTFLGFTAFFAIATFAFISIIDPYGVAPLRVSLPGI